MLKGIPNLEGKYAASDDGHIWSYKLNRFLLESKDPSGYLCVHIITDKDRLIRVHRLVALAYLSNTEKKETVDHIDRNILNNQVVNLRWATVSEQNKNREWTEKRQEAVNKGGLVRSKAIECRDIKYIS